MEASKVLKYLIMRQQFRSSLKKKQELNLNLRLFTIMQIAVVLKNPARPQKSAPPLSIEL